MSKWGWDFCGVSCNSVVILFLSLNTHTSINTSETRSCQFHGATFITKHLSPDLISNLRSLCSVSTTKPVMQLQIFNLDGRIT